MFRTARAAALLTAPMLLAVDLADAATRLDYEVTRHWVSHLSLGDRGWLGIVKLAAAGLLVVTVAIALRRLPPPTGSPGHPSTGSARTGNPQYRAAATGSDAGRNGGISGRVTRGNRRTWRSMALVGFALLAAAAFPTDAGLGYPPGTAATQTWHGRVHDAVGLLVFAGLAVAACRLGRDLQHLGHGPGWRTAGRVVAAVVVVAFLACSTLVALDQAGVLPGAPSGLFERIALYAGITWVGLAGARILGQGRLLPRRRVLVGTGART